jgi:glycogen synthase
MKVLLTTDTVGGVWTYALELSRALAFHDVRIALATMGGPLSASQRAEVSRLSNVDIFESHYLLEWMQDPWNDVRCAGDWLLDIERDFSPDVIHLNGYAHGALPWHAPTAVVAHSCVLSWWRAVKREDAPESWGRYRDEVTRGLRSAGVVIAPSHAMLDAATHHYGPFRDARVIYNARNPGPFSAPTPKEPFILTAGRLWDEAKNVSAFAHIAPQLPWPVYVAGEDQHPDGGRAETKNVHLLGKLGLDDLAPWFRRASIYALPARYEPFGLTVLEAALAGCALVLGDIPSLREIWGDAAMFVAPDDRDGLSRAITELAQDDQKRETFGARARARATRYSPDRMAREYLSLYREQVDKGIRSTGHFSDQPCHSDLSQPMETPAPCVS